MLGAPTLLAKRAVVTQARAWRFQKTRPVEIVLKMRRDACARMLTRRIQIQTSRNVVVLHYPAGHAT